VEVLHDPRVVEAVLLVPLRTPKSTTIAVAARRIR
jgi:hypothetical protein